MSKLVYQGDTDVNFGEYLPDPYIDKVTLTNVAGTDEALIEVEIHIFVKATEETDELTLIENLKKLNFYWFVGLDYTPDDYMGGTFIFDYDKYYTNISTLFTFNDLAVEEMNGFLMNDEGALGYDVFYDENGDRILKFTYKGEWAKDSPTSTWTNLQSTHENIYIYTFSTAEGFTEDHWADLQVTDNAYANSKWTTFLKTEMSNISYEPVMERDAAGTFQVVHPEEVVWMDSATAVYGKTPLQSIQGHYYKIDKLSHAQIVSSFQALVNEYQDAAANDEAVLDAINNISYILLTYGEDVDLLSQLNEYRKVFASKTSATTLGKLYGKYRKKIYSANEVIILGEELYKKVVVGTKVIDLRETYSTEYVPPGECPSCGECEILKFQVSPQNTYMINRYVFTTPDDMGEFDEDFPYGSTYGWAFFDYDRAFYYTSHIASKIDVNKLIKYFGPDVFNVNYRLKSVNLERSHDAWPGAMAMTTHYTYDNNYPEVDRTDWETNGRTATNSADYGYHNIYDAVGGGGLVANSFLLLRHFEGTGVASGPRIAERYPYGTSTGTGYVSAGAFRLMAFEFQDLMSYDAQAGEDYSYTMTVTMEDSTNAALEAVLDHFTVLSEEFEEYYETAKEVCSWNSVSNTFNQFFIDQMEAKYSEDYASAPWVKGAVLYHYYLDILYDVYEGDLDVIQNAAIQTEYNISPLTGNIPQLELFNESFAVLADALGPNGLGAESFTGETFEHTFECSLDPELISIYQIPDDNGVAMLPYAVDPSDPWATT